MDAYHLVWFKEPIGEGFAIIFLSFAFYLWLVLRSDDERKRKMVGFREKACGVQSKWELNNKKKKKFY